MPSPLLVLLAPPLLAFIAYLLRRWPRIAGIVAAIFVFALAVALSRIDLDPGGEPVDGGLIGGNTWIAFGRELTLTSSIQAILLFAYGVLTVVFLLSALVPQGRVYVSFSLAVLSPLAGALMVRPLVFGAVLLLVAAGLLAILIQGGKPGSTLASFRYLTMAALAAPLILIAGWILETEQEPLMGAVATLYLVAFVILLAGFPFQIWVSPVVSESQSLVPVMIFGVAQLMIIAFCLVLLLGSPSVQSSSQFWGVLRISGGIVLILAGLFGLTARSLGKLAGYLILINLGVVVLAFSLLDRSMTDLVMTLLIARVIGFVLIGLGTEFLKYQLGSTFTTSDLTSSLGRATRFAPVGLVLFVYGGLSILGFPLTPGFQGHWSTIDLAATQSFWLGAVLVLSIAAGTAALLRVVLRSRQQDSDDEHDVRELTPVMKWASAILIAAAVILALYPQPMIDLARRMIQLV